MGFEGNSDLELVNLIRDREEEGGEEERLITMVFLGGWVLRKVRLPRFCDRGRDWIIHSLCLIFDFVEGKWSDSLVFA